MPASFGPYNIKEVRFGTERITKIYYGSNLVYDRPYVKLKFYFDRTNVNPRGKLGSMAKASGAEWLSSSDPHVWYVITPLYTKGVSALDTLCGIGKLFCGDQSDNGLLTSGTFGTCQVLEITGAYDRIQTIDRLFQKCTAITSVSKTGFYDKFASSTALVNVNSAFNECTGITDGSSLAGYNVLKDVTSISTHSATFTNADSSTNLDQIPVGWGGTQVPLSTLMVSERTAYTSNNYTCWLVTTGAPDWTDIVGVYLLTTSSVSAYAGVSMNRSRIPNGLNGFSPSMGNALYFYPSFVQCTKIPGQTGNTVSWIATTDIPNGTLMANQGNTDMPGTLDYTTYGPLTRTYGTYSSSMDVYFTFLVTNVPITSWNGLSDAMAFLYNSNFNADAGLRWFRY